MSQPQHFSADQLADLLEGSLPAAETMSARAHLSECADCADIRDALEDVATLLAEEGATVWEMPADVAASLETAITRASLERTSGVTSLDTVRRAPQRRAVTWLGGAAAAVAIVGIGIAGWQALGPQHGTNSAVGQPTNTSPSPDGHPSSQDSPGPGSVRDPTGLLGGSGNQIYPVSSAQVPRRARWLVLHPTRRVPPSQGECGNPLGNGISTVILWRGQFAVLDVIPATRTATVFDCSTAVHSLYTTGY